MLEQETSLLNKVIDGDPLAFKAIYERYCDKIYWVSARFGLDHDDATEVVQEVFVKVWEKRKDIRTDLSFNAYLLTITKNLILKKFRSRVHEIAARKYLSYQANERQNEAEAMIVFADLLKITDGFIESLPPQQREIFRLHKLENYSAKEISDMLDLSTRTVQNHLFRAGLKLKSHLKSMGINVPMLALIGYCLY